MSTESKQKRRDRRKARRDRHAARVATEKAETARRLLDASVAISERDGLAIRVAELESTLATERNQAQIILGRAEIAERQVTALTAANTGLEQQLRHATSKAAGCEAMSRELEKYRAEDRDVLKLSRRLQERDELLSRTRTELVQARAQIPPKPLVYGGAAEDLLKGERT